MLTLILLVGLAVYLLHKYISRNYDYWKKKGVFFFEPIPFFGNFLDMFLFRSTIGGFLHKMYNQTKEPFFGIYIFDRPYLVVRTPELVKAVLVKDFKNFDDRSVSKGAHDTMVSSMLFFERNPEWKMMRTKMTPVFTTGKLKSMVPMINECADGMNDYIRNRITEPWMEIKEICAKYSTDTIARCAFAIKAHSFDYEDAEFRKIGRMIFDFTWANAIKQTSFFFLPGLVDLLKLKFVDPRASGFMKKVFMSTLQERVKSGVIGNDVIDTIIKMKDNDDYSKVLEGDKLVAQASQFFTAGFETVSSTMAFTLYELSIHPEIQDRLREEIKSCLEEHGGFTYESIMSMTYLNMCISETLRKYPVLPFLDRKCREDYTLPGTNVVIEAGTSVYIPMFGIQYDPEYFPDPEKFDPERFSEENVKNIVPFSYMPFGEGPRNCIGERFGLLGTKIGLSHMLSEFKVERCPKTPVPLEFEPRSLVLASKVGLPMKLTRSVIYP